MIVCGASFAGLAAARELAGTGARVLLLDRYEIGERQTSACAAPTAWLEALGLERSIRQTFDKLVMHTPHTTVRFPLPWTFSTFDYPQLCELLDDQNDADFETAKVEGRPAPGPTRRSRSATDRGDVSAPLVVDALGWRRVLGATATSLRMPRSRAASRYIPAAAAASSRSGSTARSSRPATDGASPPTTRCASASARSTRASTSRSRRSSWPSGCDRDAVRYQGNWIPHRLRARAEGGVFFAGDSAGHCLPLTAEGIRTALLLRHRARARAAPGGRGARHARDRAAPLRRVLGSSTSGSSAGCCARSA